MISLSIPWLIFLVAIVVAVLYALAAGKQRSNDSSNPNLRACPDCGRYVSKRALSCPHCGGPVKGY
jgi:hypothetical protein